MSDGILNIAIMGAGGRMGQMLVREVTATEGCHVIGATDREGSPISVKTLAVLPGSRPWAL